MQSDTIIGIVGAVVLVAVMVGVFAYEYNNAADDGDAGVDPGTDAAKMAAFNATYPSLGAMDDIDGDTVPNYNDTDMDGDGIDNVDDNTTCLCGQGISGTVPASSPTTPNPANTANTFMIHQGSTGGSVMVTWTVTQTVPGGPIVDDLAVSITGIQCTKTYPSATEGMAMCDLAGADPGEYTIRVAHGNAAGPRAVSFTGSYDIFY